ncbi:MAG TPA: hypothetical protein VFX70_14810 [Mycobacteriales bacterium]|nr:hypothetical protein [Mycobacteriales bacterium]
MDESNEPAPARRQPTPTVVQGQQRPAPPEGSGRQPGSAPTVVQGGTADAAAPRTIVQGASAPDGSAESDRSAGPGGAATIRQDGTVGGEASDQPVFPEALLDRFDPVAVRGTGSEAAVWEARRRDTGQPRAVKVYWLGQQMDSDHLTRLRDPRFTRHVPWLGEFGHVFTPRGQVGWTEMELLPRTLVELIDASRQPPGGVPADRARELVAELAALLRFWQHDIELNPVDFKPDNILVRSERPVELVLADFGGLAGFTATQQIGTGMAARQYRPPEEIWGEINRPWPWWGLGEIVFEIITGAPRLGGTKWAFRRDRVLGVPELRDATDPRWGNLVAGLLTRDPDDRWGYDQVSRWLAGEDPPVARPDPAADVAGPGYDPITFDGQTFATPRDLAVGMLQRWRQAAEWLAGPGQQRLNDWLADDVGDRNFDRRHYLRGLHGAPDAAHLAVTAFGAATAPDRRPSYRGEPVDADGLAALLARGADGFAEFRRLVDTGVLQVAARYRCGHPECAGQQRCGRLDAVAAEVPDTVGAVERAVTVAGRQSGEPPWGPLDAGERDRAYGLAGALALRPEQGAAIVAELGRTRLAEPEWWRAVRADARSADASTAAGRARIVAAAVLRERSEAGAARIRADAAGRRMLVLRSCGLRLSGAAVGVVALVFAVGAGAWLRVAVDAHNAGVVRLTGVAGQLDAAAALQQSRLFGALVAGGVWLALIGRRLTAVPGLAVAAAALLGVIGVQVPAFGSAPGAVHTWFDQLGGEWTGNRMSGLPLVYAVVALLLGVWASRLLGRGARVWPPERWLDGAWPATRIQRLALAPVVFVALLAALWAAVVIRLTVRPPSLGGPVSAVAAGIQSLDVPLAAGVALLACLVTGPLVRRVVAVGLLAAVVRSLVLVPPPWCQPLEHPVARGLLGAVDGAVGGAAFWMAVLVHLPVVVLGFLATVGVLGPRRPANRNR